MSPDGSVLGRAERRHNTSSPRPGWFEHDADDVWWGDLVGCLAELLPALAEPPSAVGVSGIGPCLLPADDDGRSLRPAILYGIDTRAEEQVRSLIEMLGEDTIASTGSVLTSQAVGPKMAWLARHEPEVWRRTRRFFMASSYLVHRLTGAYVLDHHSASQCSPLYDQPAAEWDAERWRLIAPDVDPPALYWSDQVVGEVTSAAAELTGLPVGIPVTAGTVDAWAEAESVLVRDPGDVMVMYGSTMFLVAITEVWSPTRTLWPTRGLRPGISCLAAGMATSGSVTEWLAGVTGVSFAALTAEAARVPPGSDGLLMLPYFAGERTPLFDPQARGVLAGLTLGHGRGHLCRAALEGVAYGVRHNLEAMTASGANLARLVAVGGGTTSLWTQTVSDVTGLPQTLPRETGGASYGDAMLAAIATGATTLERTRTWNPPRTVVEPDSALQHLHDQRFRSYRDLYESTKGLVHHLGTAGRSQARRRTQRRCLLSGVVTRHGL